MKHYALSTTLFLIACSTTNNMQQDQSGVVQPPKAKVLEHKIITHNDTIIDNYFWMRLSDEEKNAKKPNQHTKDVLDYLNAENEYLDKKMKHTEQLQTAIYEEIIARIKQDDESVPVTMNGYSYYSRFEEGQDYPFYCRKVVGSETEEIMLNGPEMGKNQSYFAIGDYTVSENNEILAYSVDYVSRRQYTIFLKNLKTGEVYEDKIENTNGGITWANDNKTIFYTKMDPVTLRSNQIYSHVIGTKSTADKLVFEEKDETFSCFIYKTKSRKYLMIGSTQTLSSEYRFLDANTPEGQWKIVQPRQRDLEYSIDHYGDDFYITTNYQAKNFRLVKTPVSKTEKENWVEVIPHRSNVLLESIDIFQKHLVVTERKNGLTHLRVIDWADKSEHYIEFNDPAYLTYT
ncbi:MAG: S9 family peptidase, partial [Crocinitomix sp.]|nr:S9 family peptidase [Crocinitomix sp.]